MRTTALILCTIWLAAQALGQSVHHVAAGSTGNRLEIEVASQGGAPPLSAIQVAVSHDSPFLSISPAEAVSLSLPAGGDGLAVFRFDVGRKAPIGKRDTLLVSVAGAVGWAITERSIVLQFDGPDVYRMDQNYPNPFNPSTTIQFQMPEESRITLVLYDLLGRRTAVVLDEIRPAGFYETVIDGRALASGAYFCRMEASSLRGSARFSETKRILLIR